MSNANGDHAGQGATRRPRRRIAKGPPRPAYLDSPDLDRMNIMFVALVAEMLALRDRLDTHEVLLARNGVLTAEAIEAFRPSEADEAVREQKRLTLMRRIFRVLEEEREGAGDAAVGLRPLP